MVFKVILLMFLISNSNEFLNDPCAESESFLIHSGYQKSEQLRTALKKMKKQYPKIVKFHSIGQSVMMRELWVIEINAKVGKRDPLTPMFRYIANSHGDEALGRKLLIFLGQYLAENYGINRRVTKLVNTTNIFLLVSMNPDGYRSAKEGVCFTRREYIRGRRNENNVDLIDNFPLIDFNSSDKNLRISPREYQLKLDTNLTSLEPETEAVRAWITSEPFVLSGNLHGGNLAVGYPLSDENAAIVKTPDEEIFEKLALTFSESHRLMKDHKTCDPEKYKNDEYNETESKMQDFSYINTNCLELSFSIACCKFPRANRLAIQWQNNKKALLSFMEAVHWGVKGLVTNEQNEGIEGAEVVVSQIKRNVTTSSLGEYWRILLPGTYQMYAAADNHLPSKEVTVVVEEDTTTIQNFTLIALNATTKTNNSNNTFGKR